MAGKTVLKYDKDGNVISTFPSIRDCMKMDNLSDYIIRKHDFIVHHINFDRLDNRVNNLIVMSLDEHTKLHRSLRNNDKMIEYCNKFNLDFNEASANIEHTK